jgi:DNA-binding NarL/FixJ family response regulator
LSELKKIIICEDHPIYAKGMEDFLQNHFKVVGNFKSGKELISFFKENTADLLLLDLNLVDTTGIEIIEKLRLLEVDVKIIIISMYNDKLLIEKCKKLGVHAYCSKHIINSELLDILRRVEDNLFLVDKSIKKKIKSNSSSIVKEDFEKLSNLTSREKELIKLFAKGLTSKEIANELFVSSFTVTTHKKNIYKKLDINSVAELVTFYYENF